MWCHAQIVLCVQRVGLWSLLASKLTYLVRLHITVPINCTQMHYARLPHHLYSHETMALLLLQPQALTLLDNDPWVATYAWFGASIPTTSWLGKRAPGLNSHSRACLPLSKFLVEGHVCAAFGHIVLIKQLAMDGSSPITCRLPCYKCSHYPGWFSLCAAYNGLMDFQTFKATALGKIYRTHRSPTCSTPASSTVQFLGPSSAATRRSTGDWVAKCGRCVEAVSGAGLASLTLEEQQLCSDCGFLNAKDAQAVARARRLHSA